MDSAIRSKAAKQATWIGAFVNAFLAVIKVVVGTIGSSHALVADGIHSLADLLTDALVLLASHFGSRDADIDHPYGHKRIETAATLALAILLVLAAGGIIYDAFEHLFSQILERPKAYVIFIAIISILTNEILYQYTLRVSKKIRSQLLFANAWHHRSDAAASIVVLVGVIGALLGYLYLDAVAAIIVGLMIVKMAWSLGWASICELVDTGVEDGLLEDINKTISNVPGVLELHQLRTRLMGENILADVHILVDSKISVSEGHYIASQVGRKLREKFNQISDVTVHIDAEDDEIAPTNHALPTREYLEKELLKRWQNCPHIKQVKKIVLHYLKGQVTVELFLSLDAASGREEAIQTQAEYQKAIQDLNYIKSVELFFY